MHSPVQMSLLLVAASLLQLVQRSECGLRSRAYYGVATPQATRDSTDVFVAAAAAPAPVVAVNEAPVDLEDLPALGQEDNALAGIGFRGRPSGYKAFRNYIYQDDNSDPRCLFCRPGIGKRLFGLF
jgi:hypothetical protein